MTVVLLQLNLLLVLVWADLVSVLTAIIDGVNVLVGVDERNLAGLPRSSVSIYIKLRRRAATLLASLGIMMLCGVFFEALLFWQIVRVVVLAILGEYDRIMVIPLATDALVLQVNTVVCFRSVVIFVVIILQIINVYVEINCHVIAWLCDTD